MSRSFFLQKNWASIPADECIGVQQMERTIPPQGHKVKLFTEHLKKYRNHFFDDHDQAARSSSRWKQNSGSIQNLNQLWTCPGKADRLRLSPDSCLGPHFPLG
jgi:hypothetical protein